MVFNVSISIVKNFIWLKQLKQKYTNEKTTLVYQSKKIINDITIHEFDYKRIDKDKNYTYNYKLKYITDLEHNNKIESEIREKLVLFENLENLNNKLNQILHCSFYWDDEEDVLVDLTSDLRHFVLHFDCDNTKLYKFLQYAIKHHDLSLRIQDEEKCGISIIKNDDFFTEKKINMKESKEISFKKIFE